MDEVIVVHFLGVDDVTVLLLAQVGGVDAVGSQELPVGHAEGLADGLRNELRLQGEGRGRVWVWAGRGGKTTQHKRDRPRRQGVRKIGAVSINRQQRN